MRSCCSSVSATGMHQLGTAPLRAHDAFATAPTPGECAGASDAGFRYAHGWPALWMASRRWVGWVTVFSSRACSKVVYPYPRLFDHAWVSFDEQWVVGTKRDGLDENML